MKEIDGKTVTDQRLIERGLLHWDGPSETCPTRHLHVGKSCPNAVTAPAWMEEEEEALIRLEQDIDSALGSHRAMCQECERWSGGCILAGQLKIARGNIRSARVVNHHRQDEATPLPEFSPVKA